MTTIEQYPVFPRNGALVRDDVTYFSYPVRSAYSTDSSVFVYLPEYLNPVEYPYSDISESVSNGNILFISSNTPYRIRDIRETDGEWISKYKTMLPLEALETLIGRATSEGEEDQVLGDPDETLDAYADPDGSVVTGVVYTNGSGRWARDSGDWVLMSPADQTYRGAAVISIDPDNADQFLDLYDNNYVSADDAWNYALPDEDEDEDSAPQTPDASGDITPYTGDDADSDSE